MPQGRGAVRRRRRAVASLACAAVLGAACNPHFGLTDDPVQRAVLTSTTGQTYAYTGAAGAVAVHAASTNTDANVREVFWTEDSPYFPDQQACNTWVTTAGTVGGDRIQPGLALRIAPSGPDGDGVKAITVNQNIWLAGTWLFHVNLWDSSSGPGGRIAEHAMFDLSPVVGKLVFDGDGNLVSTVEPAPWHVCARTQGLELTFKVWTGDDPEPAWDDPVHVYSTVLPEGWDYPGYSGGYVGHVRAGETAIFTGQTSGLSCLQPDLIGTAFCQQEFAELGATTTPASTMPASIVPVSTTPASTAPASTSPPSMNPELSRPGT